MAIKKTQTPAPVKASKKFIIDNTWAADPLISQDDVYACAQHALLGASSSSLQSLRRSVPQVPAASQPPVSKGEKSGIAWATWHHGKDFYTYWCGDVTNIVHNASLTDTERETVLLRARKAEAQGAVAFATGAKLTHQAPVNIEPSIEHIGLIIAHQF